MKKIIITAILSLVFAWQNSIARNSDEGSSTRHELSAGVGYLSNSEFIDIFENITIISTTAGSVSLKEESVLPPMFIEYFHRPINRLGIGTIFVYSQNNSSVCTKNEKLGEMTRKYFTLMPSIKFNWVYKKHLSMYTKLAAGITMQRYKLTDGLEAEEKNNEIFFNFHVTPFGIEAGGQRVRLFTEAGFGEQGIICGGLRLKL